MRMLIEASKVRTGGSIQVTLALLKNMAECSKHEWHVAVSQRVGAEVTDDLRRRFASFLELPHGSLLTRTRGHRRMLLELERTVQPSLVFSVFGPVFWRPRATHLEGFALPWAIYPESRAYGWLTARERLAYKLRNWLTRRDFRRADHLVVETETVRNRLHDHFDFPLERIHVVRNSYSPLFEQTLASLPPTPAADRYTILVPSSYYLHKNLELLAPAAALLKKRLDRPFEMIFTIAPESDGWRRIAAGAAAQGVAAELRSVGSVNHHEIGKLYRTAHLVCLPTILECSTAVYPESFMAGVPVATSDIDFAREVCADAVLYFDPYSAAAAAQALATGLTDAGQRAALVARGREVLKQNYPSPAEKWQAQLELMERLGG